MRYINQRVTHGRYIDVGGCRHNYDCFYEKIIYQISINRRKTTTTRGAHVSHVGILSSFLFLSW